MRDCEFCFGLEALKYANAILYPKPAVIKVDVELVSFPSFVFAFFHIKSQL